MKPASPICTLPPEILGEIFCQCSSFNADAPLILAVVSRHFNQVAYSDIRAWRKLRLRLGSGLGTEQSQIRKAGLWFRQSGACSLDLFLNITNPPNGRRTMGSEREWFSSSYSFLAAFLRFHRSRIRALTLRSDTELKAYHILDAISASRPVCSCTSLQLYSLHIQITNEIPPVPSGWSPVFDSFSLFPRLDSLKLINHILPALSTPNILHLRNLSIIRPLTAPPLPAHKIIRMISSAPSLVHLDIDSRISVGSIPDSSTQNDIPSLKSLSLRVNNLSSLLNLLASTTLENLCLTDLDGGRHFAGENLGMENLMRELITKDGQNRGLDLLKTLEISGIPCAEPSNVQWDWCIRHLPRLEALVVKDKDFGSASLVKVLTESGCGEPGFCCPNLSYVYLPGLGAIPWLQLLRMKRPRIRIEWNNGECRGSGTEDVIVHRRHTFFYAARGYGFGSLFDSERKITEVKEMQLQGAVCLTDVDSSW